MVFKPEQPKECKYCGKLLDKYYVEIGVCPNCIDSYGEDDYSTYNGIDSSQDWKEDDY